MGQVNSQQPRQAGAFRCEADSRDVSAQLVGVIIGGVPATIGGLLGQM
ncbi:hypothetical protein ACFQVD_15530 [Streptosporangium amethystogenes subsp. fukuiense]|uniref:Uncharacterized protein n=2 Tax=Streptosporangium TaxID=2000 RepID=A0ABW2SZL1_9ACTN